MKKKLIIIAILIMSVGFALISTNLIINGTSTIGKSSFDVYFSGAEVDGYDKTNEVVKSKKNIEFTSRDLLFTNDTSELIYEVTNNSSNYDAKVNVSCTNPSNKITVEEVPASLTVYAKTIETGSIVVTLNEMAVDPEDVIITCTLNVNAEERTSLATDEIVVGTYGISGTLVDNDDNPISDQYLAIYSETKHIVKTDMNGFFYVSNLERGIHEIYLINENDIDLSDTEIKSKIKGITSTNKNGETIEFTNKYKVKNINVGTNLPKMYQITFDTLDENIPNQIKYVSKGSQYGNLPIVNNDLYNIVGWYNNQNIKNNTTKVNDNTIFNEDEDVTVYAKLVNKHSVWNLINDNDGDGTSSVHDVIGLNINGKNHTFHIYKSDIIDGISYWWAIKDESIGSSAFASSELHNGDYWQEYEGSLVQSIVNNYFEELKNSVVNSNILEATLILRSDLESIFGCRDAVNTCGSNGKDYINYGDTWWIRMPGPNNFFWFVYPERGYHFTHVSYTNWQSPRSVRPVIRILQTELV